MHKNIISKYGSVAGKEEFEKYIQYLNKKFEPKVDKLIKNGYNINEISNYAYISFLDRKFDEVYTEYRTKKTLKG